MIDCDRVIVERSGHMVIDRLSFSVAAGETLAVIGRSGAGKSSLLAALATAIPVRGGDISVHGRSVRRDPDAARALVGYLPARLSAPPGIRVGEFLRLFAAAAGLAAAAAGAAVGQALQMADLAGREDDELERLPDGAWRLLLVARALLHAPPVLVLDDPFGNLDPAATRRLERLIDDMRLAGRTVVAAIDDARVPDCFTSLAVLHEGRLRAHGPVDAAVIAPGRRWRHRIRCLDAAEEAAAVAGSLVDGVDLVDARTFDCVMSGDRRTVADLVARLVQGGIAVAGVELHPSWTEQLVTEHE